MTLRTDLHENRWLRAQLAVLVLMAAWVPVMVVLVASPVVALLPTAVLAAAGGVCWVGAHRTEQARLATERQEAAEARELRTPRAPDAGPDQCPVCGGHGLAVLAADDVFMERGDGRAKVVPYGPRRAHWDCAEVVPHVAPPTPLGVVCTCRFCGERWRSRDMETGKARLIAHSRICPER